MINIKIKFFAISNANAFSVMKYGLTATLKKRMYRKAKKVYGNQNDPKDIAARKYSPAECTEIKKTKTNGNPDINLVSTSYIERQNLTMRMSMRRFRRLTNAFSKKIDNLEATVALHFMYYNFCRIHKTLRATPVMEAGIADHVWKLEEIIQLIK